MCLAVWARAVVSMGRWHLCTSLAPPRPQASLLASSQSQLPFSMGTVNTTAKTTDVWQHLCTARRVDNAFGCHVQSRRGLGGTGLQYFPSVSLPPSTAAGMRHNKIVPCRSLVPGTTTKPHFWSHLSTARRIVDNAFGRLVHSRRGHGEVTFMYFVCASPTPAIAAGVQPITIVTVDGHFKYN